MLCFSLRFCVFALATCCLFPGIAVRPQMENVFSHWKRVSETPIVSPTGADWESAGTFNPAVLARQ